MARSSSGRCNEIKVYVDDDTFEALTLIKDSFSFSSMSEAAASELKARLLGSSHTIRKIIERSSPLPTGQGPVSAIPR